jgi:twinkle protein
MWIVAHPAKMRRDKEGDFPAPTPYDISGSSHWSNRPDNNITVHREKDGITSVIINKVRFRMYGEIGTVSFRFDRPTNTFTEDANVKTELR